MGRRSPEQLARHREEQRLYRARHPTKVAETRLRYELANPGRVKPRTPQQEHRYYVNGIEKHGVEKARAKRRRYKIKRYGLSKASERALATRVEAAIPDTIDLAARGDLVRKMLAAVYNGRFPRRVKPEHALILLSEAGRLALKEQP